VSGPCGTGGPPGRPDLSIIVVTHNSRAYVARAIETASRSAAAAGLQTETLVVDNASTDGTPALVRSAIPTATVIERASNAGFGAANNEAFRVAAGTWWLLVNPDVELDGAAVGRLVAAIQGDDGLAVAAPTLAGGGMEQAESAGMHPGIRSAVGHFLFVNRLLPDDAGGAWRGLVVRRRPGTGLRPVDWASAAVLVLRPTAIREVGGFDERIFMYGEDLDLCARLRTRGWRVGLAQSALASHLISSGEVRTQWVDALHDVVKADGGRGRRVVFDLIVGVGLALRTLIASASLAGSRNRVGRRIHVRRMARGAARAFQLGLAAAARGD
jgi:N-acetylglucosaminyl-diphospho-decaprenol L-rhamnosyltransferase